MARPEWTPNRVQWLEIMLVLDRYKRENKGNTHALVRTGKRRKKLHHRAKYSYKKKKDEIEEKKGKRNAHICAFDCRRNPYRVFASFQRTLACQLRPRLLRESNLPDSASVGQKPTVLGAPSTCLDLIRFDLLNLRALSLGPSVLIAMKKNGQNNSRISEVVKFGGQ